MATFFFFLESGLKLDEKSIENGLEGQKFLVVCLFWGGCHHPNIHSLFHYLYRLFSQLISLLIPFIFTAYFTISLQLNHRRKLMDDQITKIRTREDHLTGTRFVYLSVVCFKFLLL